MTPRVTHVCSHSEHSFSKGQQPFITLVAGRGVEGDAHYGTLVKHRSRVARNPSQPNFRQVHLIHGELHDELNRSGFSVGPGVMGENITTRGIDLLGLPTRTRLLLGPATVVEITGLRNPCDQLNDLQPGLMDATLGRTPAGDLVRKAGVMAIVLTGGVVEPGAAIGIELPPPPHESLTPV